MSEWQKISCVLCFNNCSLEVITEGSKIVKVRGDKENPLTGYTGMLTDRRRADGRKKWNHVWKMQVSICPLREISFKRKGPLTFGQQSFFSFLEHLRRSARAFQPASSVAGASPASPALLEG